MNVEVDKDRSILLKKVYLPVHLITDSGEKMSIMMRDSGFELTYEGKRYEAKEGAVKPFSLKSPSVAKVTTSTAYAGAVVRESASVEQFVEPSFTYPKYEDVKTNVEFKITGDEIKIDFSCNGGKHGTDEALDGFEVTPDQLLNALRLYEDVSEDTRS